MQMKQFLCTVALSCGLVALPTLAQTSSQSSNPSGSSSATAAQQSSGTSASADSSSIQSNVSTALQKDDQLAGQNVNAQVKNQNITLTGTVSSQAQKDHAEQVATQAAPGYTVKNKIKVSGSNGNSSSSPMSEQQPKQ